MKKLIISLVLAMGLMGAVFGAAAGIGVSGVDELGSGEQAVTVTGSTVTDVSWTLDTTDATLVDQVSITFGAAPLTGTAITLQLWDGQTAGVCQGNQLLQTSSAVPTPDGIVTTFVMGGTNLDEPAGPIACVDVTTNGP